MVPKQVCVISEPWTYHSKSGSGSDFGMKVCIFDEPRVTYIKTRDRITGADGIVWKPRDPEKYYDERLRRVEEHRVLAPQHRLDDLALYLREEPMNYRKPTITQVMMENEDLTRVFQVTNGEKEVYDILERYSLAPYDSKK